jgi:hypothetical protein
MKCPHCGHWNRILQKRIGKDKKGKELIIGQNLDNSTNNT